MPLMDAPEYDARGENRKRNLLIGSLVFVLLLALLGVGGAIAGHGWFFSNLAAERRVSNFLSAVEGNDFNKAYAIWTNNTPNADYTIQRFTEDWTTYSPWGPLKSHKVEISKTDGTGTFGSGIIVAVQVNGSATKGFFYYDRKSGSLTYPAPHILEY